MPRMWWVHGTRTHHLAKYHLSAPPPLASTPPPGPASPPVESTSMDESDASSADRPLKTLSDSPLRQEISRLERHLQETPSDSSDALKRSLQHHLDAAKHETRPRARRSPSQSCPGQTQACHHCPPNCPGSLSKVSAGSSRCSGISCPGQTQRRAVHPRGQQTQGFYCRAGSAFTHASAESPGAAEMGL